MKRHSVAWAFAPILIVMLVQNVLSIMGVEFLFMFKAASFTGGSFMDFMNTLLEGVQDSNFSVWISIAYAVICGVWFGVWYYRLKHNSQTPHSREDVHDIAADIKAERKGWFDGYRWPIIPGMVMLAIGAQYLCTYLMNFVATLVPSWLEFYEELMKNIGLDDSSNFTVQLILYTVLLGPIVEELTFRGLTFYYARRATTFWIANLIQALLFGLLHLNPIQGIYAFALGLIFGMIYEKSRNILLTILLHIMFNCVGAFAGEWMPTGENAISFFFIFLGSLLVTYYGYQLITKSIPKRIDIEERF